MAVATPSPLQRYRAERNDLGASVMRSGKFSTRTVRLEIAYEA